MVDDGPDSMLGSPRLRVLCLCLACDGVWEKNKNRRQRQSAAMLTCDYTTRPCHEREEERGPWVTGKRWEARRRISAVRRHQGRTQHSRNTQSSFAASKRGSARLTMEWITKQSVNAQASIVGRTGLSSSADHHSSFHTTRPSSVLMPMIANADVCARLHTPSSK